MVVEARINKCVLKANSRNNLEQGDRTMKLPEGINQVNLRIPDALLAQIKKLQLDVSHKRGKLQSAHSILIEAIEEKIARGE